MKIFKENFLIFLVLGFIFLSWFAGDLNFFDLVNYATAQTSSQVTVTAYVMPTVSCSSATNTTAFGSVNDQYVVTSSPNVTTTMSCSNSSLGCTLSVKDAGNGSNPGLYNSLASYLIQSADATLSPGAEGYGIQGATTTAGSGGVLIVNSKYYKTGNQVGGLTLAGVTLASSSNAVTNREVVVTHKMAVSSVTPSGNYSDTITYSCIAN